LTYVPPVYPEAAAKEGLEATVTLQLDIDNFKAALAGMDFTDAFLPVAAISSVIPDRKNEFYKTDEDCTLALAEAIRTEYKAITDAGIVVQLDDARAAVT
jgi:5-methyltetrahydropteroyltriglutamate--homocysteine methyltransferase